MRIPTLALLGALSWPGLVLAAPAASQPPASSTPQASGQPSAADKQKMMEEEKKLTDAFKGKDNFQMKGTLMGADAEHGSIAVRREGLPIAFLIVPDTAQIQLNGRKATLADLKPGAEVRATFNLAQQYPIALSLDATPGKEPAPAPSTMTPNTPAPTK